MINVRTFVQTMFLSLSLMIGCTGGGVAGCGSDGPTSSVDTQLQGVYQVTSYQSSPEGCDDLADVPQGPSHLVIFALPDDEERDALMVGNFCNSIEDCRSRVSGTPQGVNYAFSGGSDAAGWRGYGVADQSMVGEQCLVEVQEHTMTSTGAQAIRIETRQLQTLFDGSVEGDEATCVLREAIASITNLTPCTTLFQLDGSRETDL